MKSLTCLSGQDLRVTAIALEAYEAALRGLVPPDTGRYCDCQAKKMLTECLPGCALRDADRVAAIRRLVVHKYSEEKDL